MFRCSNNYFSCGNTRSSHSYLSSPFHYKRINRSFSSLNWPRKNNSIPTGKRPYSDTIHHVQPTISQYKENTQVTNSLPLLELFKKPIERQTNTCIINPNEKTFPYRQLLHDANALSKTLKKSISSTQQQTSSSSTSSTNLNYEQPTVCFLVPNGYEYVVTQWAIWMTEAIAVPLCTSHPLPELRYVVENADPPVVIVHDSFEEKISPLFSQSKEEKEKEKDGGREQDNERLKDHSHRTKINISNHDPVNHVDHLPSISRLPSLNNVAHSHARDKAQESSKTINQDGAMLVYTSGTTGRPKGAVITHQNLHAMVTGLISKWGWSEQDHILHVLPLHHIHGIVNVLMCAMWSGALCEFVSPFDPKTVWNKLALNKSVNLFMAVPTIYARLIQYYENQSQETQQELSQGIKQLRLMVSGSAALPETVMQRWKEISGHKLLERYGMTEIGMALSNPLHPESERKPGHVGQPLPGVEVQIVDPQNNDRMVKTPGESGELLVRGPNVFPRYWRNETATRKAFTYDGWFRTGDVATFNEDGVYKILGRESQDIIKSGGYKLSALDIERELLEHPNIAEVAVIGVPDEEWGQRVGAMVALHQDTNNGASDLSLESLRKWGKERMAAYKLPTLLKIVEEIPRNVMGKVNKKQLVSVFQEESANE